VSLAYKRDLAPHDLPPKAQEVLSDICRRSGLVTPEEVLSSSQENQVGRCRKEYMKALRNLGLSYSVIGRYSNRDHTTVAHHILGR
jgi:chromosomal replication initiation ATPase DnaA